MPLLSRLFIKVAFAYLALALVLGAALAAARSGVVGAEVLTLAPSWIHLLVVGWLTQFIFGVAFWLFPRYSRDRPYGNVSPAWAAFILLNAGLMMRFIAEPSAQGATSAAWSAALIASAAGQALGALAFTVYVWPRVRGR